MHWQTVHDPSAKLAEVRGPMRRRLALQNTRNTFHLYGYGLNTRGPSQRNQTVRIEIVQLSMGSHGRRRAPAACLVARFVDVLGRDV